jgi:hypothetical protein
MKNRVRFEILSVVAMMSIIFPDVTACSLVEAYRRV